MTDTNAMREAVAQIIEQVKIAPEASAADLRDFLVAMFRDDRVPLALLATDRAAGVGEVTDAMIAAAREVEIDPVWLGEAGGYFLEKDDLKSLWSAMSAAAPQPPAASEQRTWNGIPIAPIGDGGTVLLSAAASPPAPADASDFSPHRWTEIVSNGLGANNAGCWRCGALSEVLARVLSLSGHDAKVIQGKANGEDHVWVQIGDTVYDPTVGQFQEPVSYQMDQVAPADASGEVEQIDRDAAADLLHEISNLLDHEGIGQVADLIRDGMYDEHDATVAFARHRLAARPAPAEDAVERVEVAKRLFWAETMLSEDADRIQDHWRDKWWQDLADMPLSGPGFVRKWLALADAAFAAMQPRGEQQEWPADAAFAFGALVQKKGRASWRGKIVGWYRTDITALGYAVESAFEPGSVQIYPETALLAWDGEQRAGREASDA